MVSTSACRTLATASTFASADIHIQLVLFRTQALAKYAFGLGLLQMFLCTLAFSLFSLPVGKGIGTQILEVVSRRLPAGLNILRCSTAQQLVQL